MVRGYNVTKKNYLTKQEQALLSVVSERKVLYSFEFENNALLSGLVKKGYFIRIKNGVFLSSDLFMQKPYKGLSVALQGVIGYINALHLHRLIDYEPSIIYVMVESRPFEVRIHEYTLRATTTTYKFGIEKQDGAFVTDVEKTILDCLLHPTRGGGYQTITSALSRCNIRWKEMLDYLSLFGKGSLYQKLGYLLTRLNVSIPDYVLKELKAHIKNKCRLISDTSAPYVYNSEWKIMDNTGNLQWN